MKSSVSFFIDIRSILNLLKGNTLSISVLAAKDMRHNVFNLLVKSSKAILFPSLNFNYSCCLTEFFDGVFLPSDSCQSGANFEVLVTSLVNLVLVVIAN